MAQIILIEENKNLHDLLTLNLQTYTGSEIISRENAKEAIELLKILPSVDLVISSSKVAEELSAQLLGEFKKENNRDFELIILGNFPPALEGLAKGVADPKQWEKVVELSAKILGINEDILSQKVLPDYIPIPVFYFLPLDTVCCDVFIRIKRGKEDFQFVKRIHQGDNFSKNVIQRYINQGLKYFYIPKEFQKNFTVFVSDYLVKKIDDFEGSIEEQIDILHDSFNIAVKDIQDMGFTNATIQLTDVIINSMLESIQSNKVMAKLLHKVINSKTGYLYQACHMSAIVSSEVLTNLGIRDPLTHEKMAYAAFFHDIFLADHPEYSKIYSFEQFEAAELNEEDWDMVFNHAFEASVAISSHPEAPEGVAEIIKHHHGSINGKGFSIANSHKIDSLSKIFLISREFVKELLAYKEQGGKPAPIIQELFKKYPDEDMVKAIKALEKTLKSRPK